MINFAILTVGVNRLIEVLVFTLCIYKTCIFLAQVELAYHPDNCYHNNTHAADVAQALHCLLLDRKVMLHVYCNVKGVILWEYQQ